MRNLYLGDSLDMSKRALLHALAEAGCRPLICPLPSQRDFCFGVFRHVLAVGDDGFDLLETAPEEAFWGRYRSSHWEKVKKIAEEQVGTNVILLDSDKGIHRRDRNNKFVHRAEVADLVSKAKGKVVAVYHHRNAGNLSYRDALDLFPKIPRFGYNFGAAAILFFQGPDGKDVFQQVRKVVEAQLNPKRVLEPTA